MKNLQKKLVNLACKGVIPRFVLIKLLSDLNLRHLKTNSFAEKVFRTTNIY